MNKFLATIAVCIAVFIIVPISIALADSWEGWGGGKVKTETETYLNAGSVKTGCDSCEWGFNNFMGASQSGKLSLKGHGGFESWHPDDVKVEISGGYNTGYEQSRHIFGGHQEMWGEQWANGQVKIISPH